MEPDEYAALFAAEDRHWWYVGMRRITTSVLERLYPARRDLRILDAGCGTGGAMGYLARFGPVTGCDASAIAIGFCRRRGVERIARASVAALPFAAESFDLVTSFDVLYHRAIGDWGRPLEEFRRVLAPGGRVLLRLPAYDWLRGRHDLAIHTGHRFTAGEIGRALEQRGLDVERLSYANSLLFPVALGKRLAERLRLSGGGARSDLRSNPHGLDRLLGGILGLEARWLARHSLPFGLTVLAVARKPE